LLAIAAFLQAAPKNSLRPEAHGAKARVTLTPYLADPSENTGIAVIVCPGGSYSWHNTTTEFVEVGRWLQSQGINAFVLKYRVATVAAYCTGFRVLGIGNKYPDMLEDAEDALSYLYENADSLHLDTAKIGVMGFSAGGHLCMLSYTHNRTARKPAFLCPVYPVVSMSADCTHKRSRRGALGVWRQYNSEMRDSLSLEKHITPDCPPVFLVACQDDPVVEIRNSQLLDSALTANGVAHTYLEYKAGGHGFGAGVSGKTATEPECLTWKQQFIQWISNISQQKK